MSSSYKPDHLPHLIPYLVVKNIDESVKFYQEAFGFKLVDMSYDENKKPLHVEMKRDGAYIMFCQEGAFGSPQKAPITQGMMMPLNLYVYCEDVDALYNQAIKNGAISRMVPEDRFWGDRMCAVADPNHYEWSFGTHLGDNQTKGK
jgi:uncharacterized glyoxalase superfamily protein PhnB